MTAAAARPAPSALRRSAPRDQGVDSRGVAALLDALEGAAHIEPHSLMVVRHGHVVAEGWWSPYSADGLQLLYSLSKTFTATALGLAVAEGLVSLDDTVLGHFPELADDVVDPRSRGMLVRHVAAMASGHLDEALGRARDADPADLVRGFLLTPPEREPGTVFAYNQPCTYTMGAIVARRSGQGLTDYLRPRLLDPLGIGPVAWQRDASGRELGYSGLHATTDAVARLGLLLLQRGVWDGERLLPQEWVDEASRSHVDNAATATAPDWRQGYGFQLWRGQHGYRGDGAYGQFCLVLPEQDAVVAITSATEDMQGVLDAVYAHLLPALGGRLAPDAAREDAGLARRLEALAVPPVDGVAPEPEAPWDGFRGRARDGGPVAAASLARSGGGWLLTLADAGTPGGVPLRVPVPPGAADGWVLVDPVQDDGSVLPLAVSGGWTDTGTLRVDVLFRETPHRLRLTCSPADGTTAGTGASTGDGTAAGTVDGTAAGTADGTVVAQWLTTPLGDPPLLALRAPLR